MNFSPAMSNLLLAAEPLTESAKLLTQPKPIDPTLTVLGFFAALIVGFIATNLFTRTGVIARATLKEGLRNPVFILMTVFISSFLIISIYIPFFAMKDETKFFIQCALATVLMGGMVIGLWIASSTVTEEIEGKTAMTLLSKPINRRQFILGKFLGLAQVLLMFILIVGSVTFLVTYYKAKYDAREGGAGLQEAFYMDDGLLSFRLNPQLLRFAVVTLPGLALVYMELAVMTSISVAIATRVPTLMNIVCCMTVFVVGHLTTVLVKSTSTNVFLSFVAKLFASVLPVLEYFNLDAAVATLKPVPPEYLAWCSLYSLAFITAMILFGFFLFEERDLA